MMEASARKSTDYRFDIDGLRGIAVLAVILFHIDSSLMPGGFVGVDIFFVISGYLITGHMAGEFSAGRFSLAEFYRRRIKRIAPAMLLVVACTVAVGMIILLPEDLTDLVRSAVWSVASLANVYFWREANADYFQPGSESMALLHLWSLGVEEQFYLLWPLLLMLLWRLAGAKRAPRAALLLAAFTVPMSCALTAWGFERDGMFVYYMLPTRAGELGIGAALALWPIARRDGPVRERFGGVLALLGLILVGVSIVSLSESGPFPGWRSLAPTLGAAALIAAGSISPRQWIVHALSVRPLVWVGAISYSAYLWHWPVLAFWRYLFGQPAAAMYLPLLAVVLFLSWLSYRLVEQPGRAKRDDLSGIALKLYVVPGGAIVAVCALLVFGPRNGLPLHSKDVIDALSIRQQQVRPAFQFEWACQHQRLVAADLTDGRCVLGAPLDGTVPVLLWGDSNAAHYIQILKALADKAGYRFRNIEIGSCPPLLSEPTAYVTADRHADCVASLRLVRQVLDGYPVIMLAASWTDYRRRSDDFLLQLEGTIVSLLAAKHRVVLLGKVPIFTGYDRRCEEKMVLMPWLNCHVASRPVDRDVAAVNAALREIATRHPGVEYFDVVDQVCPGGVCSMGEGDRQTRYFDAGHLSVAGSTDLGQRILTRHGVPQVLDFSMLQAPGSS